MRINLCHGEMQVLKISDVLGAESCIGATLECMSAHPAMDQVMKAHQAAFLLERLTGYARLVLDEVIEKIEAVAKTMVLEEGNE